MGIKVSALFNKWQSNSLGTVIPRLDGWGSLWHLAAPANNDKRSWIPAENKHAEPTLNHAKNVNIHIKWHVLTINLKLSKLNLQKYFSCTTSVSWRLAKTRRNTCVDRYCFVIIRHMEIWFIIDLSLIRRSIKTICSIQLMDKNFNVSDLIPILTAAS